MTNTYRVVLDAQVTAIKYINAETEEEAVDSAVQDLEFDVAGGEVYAFKPVTVTKL